jgi:fermentation-respiration switch protein FrsA (DUF1100 family)
VNGRRLVLAILSGCGVCALLAVGWWLGDRFPRNLAAPEARAPADLDPATALRQTLAEKEQRITDLERELGAAARVLGEQRRLLREHALHDTVRSVDELLGLFPAKYPAGNWQPAETLFEDCWFPAVDGIRLHGWYLKHPHPKAALLYVHGNAGNLSHRAAIAMHLRDGLASSVLLFDYRGYGRSEGVPTIEGLLRDARAARDHLAGLERIEPKTVVLMGHSLGGGVAVVLAAEDGARGLILESTFSSLREAALAHYPRPLVNALVADRLNSAALIPKYRGPLLQSHGDADRIVPFALGRALFDAAHEPKTFVTLPGGDHNDAPTEDYDHEL